MNLFRGAMLFLFLAVIFTSGCSAVPASVMEAEKFEDSGELKESPEEDDEDILTSRLYIRPEGLTAQETVEEYLLQQYRIYAELDDDTELSSLVDLSESRNEDALVWLQALVQRRKLLMETDLCYVETRMYPYTVNWIEEDSLEDERMSYWMERLNQKGETALHFTVTGEPGRGYPPMLALNAQHTVFLKQIDGEWMITFHYYPGARRRSGYEGPVFLQTEEQMLDDLWDEFRSEVPSEALIIPTGAAEYNASLAVEYALQYTETPNPDFYHVGDWMGNCSNFVSQCVWYAFGEGSYPAVGLQEYMTDEWFAGPGGGSSAWENVSRFWTYVGSGGELQGMVLSSADELIAGDIIQFGSVGGEEELFNHCLLVVDEDTLLLAQNSPACFVYYSDLVLVEARYFRPVYLQ